MKSYVKYIGNGVYQVVATGEEFQRWARGMEQLHSNIYYKCKLRRDVATRWNFFKGVLSMWRVIHDKNYTAKGTFEWD